MLISGAPRKVIIPAEFIQQEVYMFRLHPRLYAAAILLLMLSPLSASGSDFPSEKWYTDRWCALEGGTPWVRMADGGRCDCLTPTHAVEIAPAVEWADAVGWSLRSALQTGRRAGIVLIEEGAADAVHRQRLDALIERFDLPIRVWSTSRGAGKN
jgi:hypothetical protein